MSYLCFERVYLAAMTKSSPRQLVELTGVKIGAWMLLLGVTSDSVDCGPVLYI